MSLLLTNNASPGSSDGMMPGFLVEEGRGMEKLVICLSVHLSVTEVHWRIIANLSFKFRSKFTAHCGHGACREEGRGHLVLC